MFPTSLHAKDVRIIADLLLAVSTDETITYEYISGQLGFDITRKRYLLPAAMKLVSSESGVNFTNVRGVGYRRLPNAEVHQLGMHARRRVRNTSRRASSAIGSTLAKANDMENADLLRALKEMSVLDLLRHIATDRVVKAMPDNDKPESVSKTMSNVVRFINGNNEVA